MNHMQMLVEIGRIKRSEITLSKNEWGTGHWNCVMEVNNDELMIRAKANECVSPEEAIEKAYNQVNKAVRRGAPQMLLEIEHQEPEPDLNYEREM